MKSLIRNLLWICSYSILLLLSCTDVVPESMIEEDNQAGDMNNQAGDVNNPAGDMNNPAIDMNNPAGDMNNPAGDMNNPAGDMNNQAGDMNNQAGQSLYQPDPLDCGDLTQCGATCANLSIDPINCGGCGRTCRIPNATATCIDGQCSIDRCHPLYFDIDQQLNNGCESFNDCVVGESCLSECDSEGSLECLDGQSICRPPNESCNLIDDDCDGVCDEDWSTQGCRVGVHRGYGRGEHIYSTDLSVVTGNEHNLERQNYFYLSTETLPNSRPVFYCKTRSERPFLSTLTDCGIGRSPLQTLGFWLAAPTCNASPLYYLTLNNDRDYFYTTSAAERDSAVGLGYQAQGIVGYIWLP